MSITVTAKQLREALEFINPDGPENADQLETEVTITYLQETVLPNGELMPSGYYAWSTEYPEEGCIPLFDPAENNG